MDLGIIGVLLGLAVLAFVSVYFEARGEDEWDSWPELTIYDAVEDELPPEKDKAA